MKYSEKIIVARTNDIVLLPVIVAGSGREMSIKLHVCEGHLSHCAIDKTPCKNLIIDVVDMSNDLEPNTWEDYIEFCKFEKSDKSRIMSLLAYQNSLKKEQEFDKLYSIKK